MDDVDLGRVLRRTATLIDQQRWLDVIDQVEPALTAHPETADLWLALARSQAELPGRESQAVLSARRAVALAPQDQPTLRRAAAVLLDAGDARSAADLVGQAVKLDDTDAEAQRLLALTLDARGEEARSVQVARRAVELAPRSPASHLTLVELLGTHYPNDEALMAEAAAHYQAAVELSGAEECPLSEQTEQALAGYRLRDASPAADPDLLQPWVLITTRVIRVVMILAMVAVIALRLDSLLATVILALSGGLTIGIAALAGIDKMDARGRAELAGLLRWRLREVFGVVSPMLIIWIVPVLMVPLISQLLRVAG